MFAVLFVYKYIHIFTWHRRTERKERQKTNEQNMWWKSETCVLVFDVKSTAGTTTNFNSATGKSNSGLKTNATKQRLNLCIGLQSGHLEKVLSINIQATEHDKWMKRLFGWCFNSTAIHISIVQLLYYSSRSVAIQPIPKHWFNYSLSSLYSSKMQNVCCVHWYSLWYIHRSTARCCISYKYDEKL